MISHTVFFKLKHPGGSAPEKDFLAAALRLGEISVVKNLKAVRQTSPKSAFAFGLVMQFLDEADYRRYNEDPRHVDFVERRWKAEVESFQELDFVELD